MDIEIIRQFCLALPNVTEDVKWEKDLTFLIGEKMSAVLGLEFGKTVMSFKCTPETFDALIERENIIPAPYLGRYKWVGLETFDAIEKTELHELLKKSYTLVFEKLPKKLRDEIDRT